MSLVVVEDEDVATVEGQSLEPRPNFRQRERQGVRRQEQILGVRQLGTPSALVLYDGAPQVDLTVDSVLLISRAEMVERFGGVDAAGAIHLRVIFVNITAAADIYGFALRDGLPI